VARSLTGLALVVLGVWIILAAQWGLELIGEVGWMWLVSLAAGLIIAVLGVVIAVIEARRSPD
jgi:hypothetical protein